MVTYEEMKIVMEIAEKERKQASYSVTPEEMQRFKVNNKLPSLISTKKTRCFINSRVWINRRTLPYQRINF